jgi:hypothetical protein
MSAIISTNFRLENANNFRDSIINTDNSAYVFIGKADSWTDTLGDASELTDVPSVPNNTLVELNDSWQNMIAMKKITAPDVINMVPRHDWESKIYPAWDDNDSFVYAFDNAFYVLTVDFNVYKCVYSPGTASFVKPTHTTAAPRPADPLNDDGYLWKYMYTVQSAYTDFLTINYMPVKRVLSAPGSTDADFGQWNNQVTSAALKGKIYRVVVEDGGTGYDPETPPAVTILGDGVGATAVAVVNTLAPFNITAINIVNSSAQTQAYNVAYVTVAPPVDGTTATARAVLSPKGGHGTDAASELGGFYVGIKVTLAYSENSADPGTGPFITDGSFRQLGIVKNPYEYGTTDVGFETTYSALKSLVVSSPSNISAGDYIEGQSSGAKAYIDSWHSAALSTTGTLKYHQNDKTGYTPFEAGETFTTNTSGSGTIDTIVAPYSGDCVNTRWT